MNIELLIENLDNPNKDVYKEAVEQIRSSLSTNDETMVLLLEQYYASYSENVANMIVTGVTENLSRTTYNFMRDTIRQHPDDMTATLRLLIKLLSRTESEPTWIYNIVQHELFILLIQTLEDSNLKSVLPLGLVFISMLIPLAPVRLSSHFAKLANMLSKTLLAYHSSSPDKLVYVRRLCFQYFVTLYSIYPLKTVSWCSSLHNPSPVSNFIFSVRHLIPIHSALLKNKEYAAEISDQESHDIVWEIGCYTLNLDLLLEHKMLLESGEDTSTCTGSDSASSGSPPEEAIQSTQNQGCQTEPNSLMPFMTELYNDEADNGLLNTYLKKKLDASAALYFRRRNSRKFDHDDIDFSKPELDALEGELMLEKYLRYQHSRRNRRYLNNVRAIEEERSLNHFHEQECTRLKAEVDKMAIKIDELVRTKNEQVGMLQRQLVEITSQFNSQITSLKLENTDLKRRYTLDSKLYDATKEELLKLQQKQDTELSERNLRIQEKLRELDLLKITNESLKQRNAHLQNQLFVVSEIRTFQANALNALKPFCSKETTHPYLCSSLELCAPNITNLEELASDTARKLKESEVECNRLRSQNASSAEENERLREKYAKQKDLTEKTTNFWEQKYSALEKTCEMYKNNYREICQQVIKLKRDSEPRRRL